MRNFKVSFFCISIHAPRTGSDYLSGVLKDYPQVFQSTLPVRGATGRLQFHKPANTDFNPRSPYGERHKLVCGRL